MLLSVSIPCTSTICELHYSTFNYLLLYEDSSTPNKSLIKVEFDKVVPPEYVRAPLQDRKKPFPYVKVEIYTNIPLLQYLTIIDTPGLNECNGLNERVRQCVVQADAVIVIMDFSGAATNSVCFIVLLI